jgi:hypothetical protein
LFSVWMAGKKMLVAVTVVRLRNRRAELTFILRHMRAATTTLELVRVTNQLPSESELEAAIALS